MDPPKWRSRARRAAEIRRQEAHVGLETRLGQPHDVVAGMEVWRPDNSR